MSRIATSVPIGEPPPDPPEPVPAAGAGVPDAAEPEVPLRAR